MVQGTQVQRGRAVLAIFFAGMVAAKGAHAQFNFADRTAEAGIDYTGESYGSSWGDLNADGLPDIYVNNHREKPALYVNQGDGTFVDTVEELDNILAWKNEPFLDQHGAAWGDFNKDGFQDLFQSLGAADENQFMVNSNGLLVDRASEFGIEFRTWPGRLPIWLDGNLDGDLDFTVMQRGRPQLFAQIGGQFTNVTTAVGMTCEDNQWGHLIDLNEDGQEELICAGQASWPQRVYDLSTSPYTNLTSTILPSTGAVVDSITGDFNGDLRSDIFILRGTLRPSDAYVTTAPGATPAVVQAQLVTSGSREETLTFQSSGVLTVEFEWNARNITRMYIGATGVNPTGFGGDDEIVFTLDPSDPSTHGLLAHDPAVDEGVYMGYDPATQTWTFSMSPGGSWSYSYFTLTSTAEASNVVLTGPGGAENGLEPAMFVSGPAGYTNQAASFGFTERLNCGSAVAGDFDNDMDEDIYVVCRDGVSNLANRLFENQGNGTFAEVVGAGGAEGITGFNVGNGESVTTGDYDLNGFLDLYVTNGLNLFPEPPFSLGGPDQLIANLGNGNSWVELELVGTTSTAPAVGSRVLATAGGITQMREQNGGYHRYSQNHQRIHFGLGTNSTTDIEVRWPSGVTEIFPAVAANAIYKVTEGSGIELLVPTSGSNRVLSIDDIDVSEVAGTARFTVSLIGVGSDDVTVDYTTVDDTAQTPDDYSAVSGSLLFTGGSTEEFIEVPIIDDLEAEGGEAFRVQLSNSTNAILAKSVGIGDIFDNDVTLCGPPVYDPTTEATVLLWEDCSGDTWTFRSTGGGGFTQNIGLIESSEALVVTPFSIEGHDILDLSDPDEIDFNLRVWGGSEDGFQFVVAPGSQNCVTLAPGSTVPAVEVGPDRIPVALPFNLDNLGPCVEPPPDPALGEPSYNPATEAGFFVWKTPAGNYVVRTTAGGTFAQWIGSITSSAPLQNFSRFSIEGHDVIDEFSDPSAVSFNMRIWGSAEDGFEFEIAEGSGACVDLSLPAGATVIVGGDNTPVNSPFDLETLGACTP